MNQIRLLFLILLLSLLNPGYGNAQNAKNLGIDTRAYPAGVILGVRGGVDLGSHNEINLHIGYNITRRGDFGKKDNEEGGGPGFGLSYKHYLPGKLDRLFLGVRADMWFMDIDWSERREVCGTVPPCIEQEVNGTTKITVLQPTLQAGYNLLKNSSEWILTPSVSFGYEINIRTRGEEVGEGAILLGGLSIGYKF